ncbi:helix-turn-helix domain-containing protein [Pedobacter sp. PLR]|uniref:helix-turn-helix domain-containing protein n=1 Tax=Pedobacter sp. PLR TaxID=2994465 RepID=UPI002247A1F3|nr:helix-turn-helix domain-containing protein [Pedobacter sp. PLR]MCX2451665.1 helix-turn-helix domain-containing protein [Pedobacter sp. PLR]
MPTPLHQKKKPDQKYLYSVFERLDYFFPLPLAAKLQLSETCYEIHVRKNEYLLRKGDYSYFVYFIIEGILTGEATSGKQVITSFICVQGEFVSAIEGIYGIVPATEDIKAEEDSLLLGVHVDDLEKLTADFPEMNIVMRKVMELYYKIAHHRSVFFRIGTASDKYADFLKNYPHHATRIPLELVASYLNIKITTLKKIVSAYNRQGEETVLSKESIAAYLEEHHPYRQKKLSLAQLAEMLNVSSHTLSHLLNLYFQQNFSHFINTYRVNYILAELQNKDHCRQYSLDGLGREAGFSSRSSFFYEFKRQKGITPHNYLQQQIDPPL